MSGQAAMRARERIALRIEAVEHAWAHLPDDDAIGNAVCGAQVAAYRLALADIEAAISAAPRQPEAPHPEPVPTAAPAPAPAGTEAPRPSEPPPATPTAPRKLHWTQRMTPEQRRAHAAKMLAAKAAKTKAPPEAAASPAEPQAAPPAAGDPVDEEAKDMLRRGMSARDVAAETGIGLMRASMLAHQVRQERAAA